MEEMQALVPHQRVNYICEKSHGFSIALAPEAKSPQTWECPRCFSRAYKDGIKEAKTSEENAETKSVRTPWVMLRERRSIKELEEILSEQLTLLRVATA